MRILSAEIVHPLTLPSSFIISYITYSEWSYAQVRGIDGRSICTFDSTAYLGTSGNTTQDLLIILSSDGLCTKCIIPNQSGDCPRLAVHSYLRSSREMINVNDGDRAYDRGAIYHLPTSPTSPTRLPKEPSSTQSTHQKETEHSRAGITSPSSTRETAL